MARVHPVSQHMELHVSGKALYNAASAGKTADVRRLLKKKAPLEYKSEVRHRPYRKSTTRRPAYALSLWQKAARRGLERRRRTRAGRPLPLPLPPPLSRARSLSLALTPCASLSHKRVHALAAAG